MTRFFTTPAVVLSRRAYADSDLIVTVLSREFGKCTLMAKSAKKSIKRFSGSLEPFTLLQIVYRQGRGRGMPLLEEASLEDAFGAIRGNILKTAYACYWAELISLWHEEGQAHRDIYQLLTYVFTQLDRGDQSEAMLNILFQLRFVGQEGFRPILEHCSCCQVDIDDIIQQQICFDLKKGGLVCSPCLKGSRQEIKLSKGTLKQLQWLMGREKSVAERVRFSPQAISQATEFLEAFVPFHIGRRPKSLTFLQQIRAGK